MKRSFGAPTVLLSFTQFYSKIILKRLLTTPTPSTSKSAAAFESFVCRTVSPELNVCSVPKYNQQQQQDEDLDSFLEPMKTPSSPLAITITTTMASTSTEASSSPLFRDLRLFFNPHYVKPTPLLHALNLFLNLEYSSYIAVGYTFERLRTLVVFHSIMAGQSMEMTLQELHELLFRCNEINSSILDPAASAINYSVVLSASCIVKRDLFVANSFRIIKGDAVFTMGEVEWKTLLTIKPIVMSTCIALLETQELVVAFLIKYTNICMRHIRRFVTKYPDTIALDISDYGGILFINGQLLYDIVPLATYWMRMTQCYINSYRVSYAEYVEWYNLCSDYNVGLRTFKPSYIILILNFFFFFF